MDYVQPKTGVSTPIHTQIPHTSARKEPRFCTDECGGHRDYPPRDRSVRRLPDQASLQHTLGHHGGGGACPRISTNVSLPNARARQPEHRHICRGLWHDWPQTSDRWGGSGTRARQNGPTAATRPDGDDHFGASWHGELETLAFIVDIVTVISKTPRDQPHHVWVVIDAAVDFQIVRRLARQPLHMAKDSSLGTQALHLWVALRSLPGHVILHLIKQESHRYNLGNGHIHLHAHNQLAEHVPTPNEPPLHDHMHTHLQDLPQIPYPGEPPPRVPNDVIYDDMGRSYHYPQPLTTMAHIPSSHADNTLMIRLQQELQLTLY